MLTKVWKKCKSKDNSSVRACELEKIMGGVGGYLYTKGRGGWELNI